MDLTSKVIVVTGGAQGIGLAIAERCVASGAAVAIWDVKADAVGAAVGQVQALAPAAVVAGFTVDVSDFASVQAATVATQARFGRIDGLVNNAGVVADAQLTKMSEAQWDRVIDINLKGVFNCARATVDALIASGGAIVNISSIVGLSGNFGQSNYAAAKAGVLGLTRTWTRELGRKGVRCNAVCPGFIDTSIVKDIPQPVLDEMVAAIPQRRMGQPREIASAVVFLLSDEASYVNGATLEVAGGLTLQRRAGSAAAALSRARRVIDQISAVFARYPQVGEVRLYGSRAKGGYRPGSDIDLAIMGDTLSRRQLLHIASELEDLSIPYTVGLSLFSAIENPIRVEQIEQAGKTFYRAPAARAS